MSGKKSLKSLIITDIAVLGCSLLMLVTLTFAWFISTRSYDAPQQLSVGSFDIKLTDDIKETGALSGRVIEVENAYPMTFAQAKAEYEQGKRNSYVFWLQNTGVIPVQYRLYLQTVSDSGYGAAPPLMPLCGQFRFAARPFTPQAAKPEFTEGGFLFGGENNFKQFFNNLLLKSGTQGFVSKEPLLSGTAAYFELLVWLDERATVESTGAPAAGGVKPEYSFKVMAEGMQSGGGAHFTAAEIQDSDDERKPTP